jgi:hypothetical protein
VEDWETMPEIHKLAEGGAYEPDTLELLSTVLAEVWTQVGPTFTSSVGVERARNLVAQCLLHNAGLGLRDPTVLKALALATLRQSFPTLGI